MPKKGLGQHFLSDPRILARIAAAVPAESGAAVLEIGPGKGALTRALVHRGFRLTMIERDRDLIAGLAREFPESALVEADALEVDWPTAAGVAPGAPWYVVGNIPYHITSPLIEKALDQASPPAAIVYLIQKEVAVRLTAAPGTADYGALTVGVGAAAIVERLFTVPAGAFWPVPKIDSAVIRLRPRPTPLVRDPRFRRLVVGLFGGRRKQLVRALRTVLDLGDGPARELVERAGLRADQRPETVDIAGFVRLLDVVVDAGRADGLAL